MSFFESLERLLDAKAKKFDERTAESEQCQNEHYVQNPRLLIGSCDKTYCSFPKAWPGITYVLLKKLYKVYSNTIDLIIL